MTTATSGGTGRGRRNGGTTETMTATPPRRHTATEEGHHWPRYWRNSKVPTPWRPPHHTKAEELAKEAHRHRHQFHTEATTATATSEGRGGGKTLYHDRHHRGRGLQNRRHTEAVETMTQRRQRRRPPRHTTDTMKATTGHQWRHTATKAHRGRGRGTFAMYLCTWYARIVCVRDARPKLYNARKTWTDLGEMP